MALHWLRGLRTLGGTRVVVAGVVIGVAISVANPALGAGTGRAYELVAPEHQGFPTGVGPLFGPPNSSVWVSPEGGQIAFGSPDAFVGQSGQAPTYLSTRGAARWSTVGLFPRIPQGSLLNPVQTVATSANHSRLILSTAASLDPADANGSTDTYMWEPGPQVLTWVSRSDQPGAASYVGRSADAHHVVFSSDNNLVPAASGSGQKLYEWKDGVVTLVSVKPDGSNDPGGATLGILDPGDINTNLPVNAVSRDGSRIAFSSPALSASTSGDPTRLYVRLDGAQTVEASASHCARGDCNVPSAAAYAGATPDGAHIFFTTAQQLTNADTDDASDLYVYDVATDDLTLLSAGIGATQLPTAGSVVLGASDDGTRVYFRTTDNALVLWDHGALVHVADLLDADAVGATPRCVQSGADGIPEVTSDGSVLVFTAPRLFVPSTPGPSGPGLYRYSAATGDITRIADSGSLPGDNSGIVKPECYLNRGITNDGESVFFETTEALVPQDVNGVKDVYEWHSGQITLVSSGTSDQDSSVLGSSADGRDVFFTTTDRLTADDKDTVQDIYDARQGGFPSPGIPRVACAEEDCQGPLAAVPHMPTAGSASLVGLGNERRSHRAALEVNRIGKAALARAADTGRLPIAIRVDGNGVLVVRAWAKLGGRAHAVASLARRVANPGRLHVSLRLSARARRKLTRTHVLRLRVEITFSTAKPRVIVVSVHQ